jgi:hypothetical protein
MNVQSCDEGTVISLDAALCQGLRLKQIEFLHWTKHWSLAISAPLTDAAFVTDFEGYTALDNRTEIRNGETNSGHRFQTSDTKRLQGGPYSKRPESDE